jgi:cytochrome b561
MKDTQQQLSFLTVSLHWLIALGMIMLIAVGIYMEENKAFELYPIHKSVGIVLFGFIIFRVFWRMKNGWLQALSEYKPVEIKLARAVQWLLIIGTIMMPVSGIMMSGAGGFGVSVFGLELIAKNPDPDNAGKVIALNAAVAKIASSMHSLGGNLMIAAILLHVLGAVKQKVIYKDGAFARMFGKKV